uniref:Uncharacterized protein n=1 Tax=Kalanchoe fedtschenkoi TaxID=63787 RepID=A0A7N0UEQ7_KALFE
MNNHLIFIYSKKRMNNYQFNHSSILNCQKHDAPSEANLRRSKADEAENFHACLRATSPVRSVYPLRCR